MTGLRERHNITHKTKVVKIDFGDVVMIKGSLGSKMRVVLAAILALDHAPQSKGYG